MVDLSFPQQVPYSKTFINKHNLLAYLKSMMITFYNDIIITVCMFAYVCLCVHVHKHTCMSPTQGRSWGGMGSIPVSTQCGWADLEVHCFAQWLHGTSKTGTTRVTAGIVWGPQGMILRGHWDHWSKLLACQTCNHSFELYSNFFHHTLCYLYSLWITWIVFLKAYNLV